MENIINEIKDMIYLNIADALYGIFDTNNICGDMMTEIYRNAEYGVSVSVCYDWGYFEVLGISSEDFCRIKKFYDIMADAFEKGKAV